MKEIVAFPDYFITQQGSVESSRTGKILKGRLDKNGYLLVNLYKDRQSYTRKVHRLVAEAFIPNPDNKTQVNHKDGNKSNNHVINLEWSTQSENMRHAYRNGLNHISDLQRKRTSEINKVKLKGAYTWSHPEYGQFLGGQRELSRLYNNPNQGNLSKLITGELKSVKGWKLIDP